MKRKQLVALLICLLLVSSLPAAAFADGQSAAERGLEAIMATGRGDRIVLPKEESYLEEWKTLYCRKAWYAPSLWVESISQLRSGVLLVMICEMKRCFDSTVCQRYESKVPSVT